jgi:hypothetical protein
MASAVHEIELQAGMSAGIAIGGASGCRSASCSGADEVEEQQMGKTEHLEAGNNPELTPDMTRWRLVTVGMAAAGALVLAASAPEAPRPEANRQAAGRPVAQPPAPAATPQVRQASRENAPRQAFGPATPAARAR